MTPREGAKKLRAKTSALRSELRKALTLSAKQGADIGKSLSRGGYTQKQLTAMGHPYAVRHVATAAGFGLNRRQYALKAWGVNSIAADYIINKQTGEFARYWQRVAASAFRGGLVAWTINNSRVAGFLAGRNRPRSRMILRPIDSKVAQLLRPIMVDNVQEAVRRALRA